MNKVESKGRNPPRQVENNGKKRKCLYHPAMQCPTPEEPCIFTRDRSSKNSIERPHQKSAWKADLTSSIEESSVGSIPDVYRGSSSVFVVRRMVEGRKGERRVSPKIGLLPFFSRFSIDCIRLLSFSVNFSFKPRIHRRQQKLPRAESHRIERTMGNNLPTWWPLCIQWILGRPCPGHVACLCQVSHTVASLSESQEIWLRHLRSFR